MINNDPEFGFEVDALAVGDEGKSGDAICLRWGYLKRCPIEQFVCVIDGGFNETGEAIEKQLKNYYHTNKINFIINTHPHNDHIGGLKKIIENFEVGKLILNTPWTHNDLKSYFDDDRRTDHGIKEMLMKKFGSAKELCAVAKRKGISICSCFSSNIIQLPFGVDLCVLGPSKDYYNRLIPDFIVSQDDSCYKGSSRVKIGDILCPSFIFPLSDKGDTSSENNSSLILAFRLPNGKILLFTGDAGMPALENAIDEAQKNKLDLPTNIVFLHLPHHGSIQNIGPTVLDKILGPEHQGQKKKQVWVLASASKNDENHPAKHVVNAVISRQGRCFTTKGKNIRFSFENVPVRDGWVEAKSVPFFKDVEVIT